jgi:ATP-dependent RNA helicase RhlE
MNDTSFEALPLAAPLQKALSEKGYTTPSPIQAQAIPVLLQGRDLLGCAQTGTGKTAAFALPILNRLAREDRRAKRGEIRTLVLAPTRELAVQVAESFRDYGKYLEPKPRVELVYGGVGQNPQVKNLRAGLDVLVACPGRLLDLYQQGHVDFSGVDCLVLDEADRMLDMGFINDIRKITKQLPQKRHTLLFSATMAPEILKLAQGLMRDPEEIRIAPQGSTAEKVEQSLRFVKKDDKLESLLSLLRTDSENNREGLNLIFSRTKHGARKLERKLSQAGFQADSIHGNKSQNARQKSLSKFRDGKTRVLVATDVAARGIDVRNITLVVNYDVPREADSYVHRIGRTARAGAGGQAVTLCAEDEIALVRAVEKLIKSPLPIDAGHEFHCEPTAARYSSGSGKGKSGNGKNGGSRNRSGRNRRNGGARNSQSAANSGNGNGSNDDAKRGSSNRRRRNRRRGGRSRAPVAASA